MLPSPLALALALASAPVPAALSPEAGEHNARAMQYYDRRQFEPAFAAFQAAYDAMPDPRGDRAGRELLLGSMRATLLEWYDASGDPGPLCRLEGVLQRHADALAAAYPGDPEMLELRSVRARHDEVTRQLAGLGPGACAPPPPVGAAPPPTPVGATPPPAPVPKPLASPATGPTLPGGEPIPPHHLRIAGGVTLGLGAALLGVMTYGIVAEARRRADAGAFATDGAVCPLSTAEYSELTALRRDALAARYLAIGTGLAAGVTAALGTTLLVLAGRSARARRLAVAPWWAHTGAGLIVRINLGTVH